MKKEIVSLIVAIALIFAGGGFLLGRRFPAHHYEHLAGPDVGYARYLFIDTGTGKVCDSMKPFEEQAEQAARNVNLLDRIPTEQGKRTDNFFDDLLAKKAETTPDRRDYIPACGKE